MNAASLSEAAEHLLLARLLVPAKKPPSKAELKKSLASLFTHRLSAGEWTSLFDAALARLIEAELVTAKPLALTAAGRERALAYWQIADVPPRTQWKTLLRSYLAPRVLGLAPERLRSRKPADALIAAVVQQKYELPAEAASLTAIVNALAWQQLGIKSTAKFTPTAVVGKLLLDSDRKLATGAVAKNLARTALETAQSDLFAAALQQWVAGSRHTPCAVSDDGTRSVPAASDDLSRFADIVRRAARASHSGWFGENKVYISHTWQQLQTEPEFSTMPLDQFKQRLVEAHRQRLLELSRADLVDRMDPRDVGESETLYLDSRFHFVCVGP